MADMQYKVTASRTSAGSTASDGWLWFPFSSSFTLGKEYKVTSVYVKFTRIKSASGAFTGDVPVQIITPNADYDAGYIYGYTFPASTSTSGVTISGYLDTPDSVLEALATAEIERVDLGQSTYGGGKDIRCFDDSECELTLIYEYAYTKCSAPTACAVNDTLSTGDVTLSWSGAAAGTVNSITGYEVEYADSSDGKTWSDWSYYDEVESTQTSASLTVSPPDTPGHYRKFRVRTLGEAGTDYYSGWKESTNTLRKEWTKCSAPTSVTVSATNVAPGAKVKLEWDGAYEGDGNAIAGYEIHRATSATGTYTKLTSVATTNESGSIDVTAPTANGSYYYKVLTLGAVSGYNSALSTKYATLTCQFTAPSAPKTVTVSATSTMDSAITLSWTKATAGTNNSITGYKVEYADSANNAAYGTWTTINTYSSSTLSQSVTTPAVGVYRKYRVTTIGTYSNSSATVSSPVLRLQTVTRCIAPTTVTIEKSITAAATNTLTWSGAKEGTNNKISGYFIQYVDSADGKNWGSTWGGDITVGVVSSSSVPMPADNTYRKYRVFTLGAAGSNWRSASGTESAATYRGHAALAGFTDSPLVKGTTPVKALHMQELQDRANQLREFYGLASYKFTTITSGTTGLRDWTAHVNEIRAAVDGISTNHDKWISISVNCPRADVIEQLRAVILAM